MIRIRKATINDVYTLQTIGKETFLETFIDTNTQSDMENYLEKSFNIPQLATELNNPNSEFYFVENEHQVIGYLKVNVGTAQTENVLENSFEIQRIYVLASFHGQGIGYLLFEKAQELAKNKKADCIWLGVWEKNQKAIQFYEKIGFNIFDSHDFVLGTDVQTDVLMKLKLTAIIE